MNPPPLVSAIIPVHNSERYLGEAIESVLAQTYRPIELVIVDDGSVDATAAVCQRFPGIRYIHQSQAGAAAARNRGVEAASGALLSFLDADDLWVPEKLARQTALLDADPRLDMVLGRVRQFHSPELDLEAKTRIAGDGTVLAGHVGTLLIRRASFLRVGPFTTEWRVGEFIDWFARTRELGLAHVTLPEVTLLRRLHTRNMMVRERHSTGDYARIVKAALDRRRAAGAAGREPASLVPGPERPPRPATSEQLGDRDEGQHPAKTFQERTD